MKKKLFNLLNHLTGYVGKCINWIMAGSIWHCITKAAFVAGGLTVGCLLLAKVLSFIWTAISSILDTILIILFLLLLFFGQQIADVWLDTRIYEANKRRHLNETIISSVHKGLNKGATYFGYDKSNTSVDLKWNESGGQYEFLYPIPKSGRQKILKDTYELFLLIQNELNNVQPYKENVPIVDSIDIQDCSEMVYIVVRLVTKEEQKHICDRWYEDYMLEDYFDSSDWLDDQF